MSDCRPSFGGGTDSNSTRHHLHHSKNKRHYDVLTSSRYEDVKETFSEEFHETGYRRRKRNYSEERLTDSEDELDTAKEKDDLKTWEPETSDKGAQLLAKMGYGGGGLGKSGQGREEPIPLSSQHGRVGLGYSVNKALTRDLNVKWDEQQEDKSYEEEVIWISASDRIRENFLDHISKDWVQEGERKLLIDDETSFCDETLLKDMLHAKSLFDELKDYELRKARARANPFETIGSVFFQNRAAVKAANIDRLTNWLMTDENPETMERKTPLDPKQKRINTDRPRPLFYFADVCAGPGGFSEYVLWRKGFYNARGFGFTLKGGWILLSTFLIFTVYFFAKGRV
ncbi:hypothetical protein AB6A40_010859 [Gnathostoma spinigerum]|uniref:Cap-specific mRNA (nucleoside-2'-O-)-methyltransferase 1 n=1 Tax=Gnathostoma spinigerum TaxID=75299 RepID=A0ABD6F418_9BILA